MSRARSRSVARLAAVQALYQLEMENTPIARLLHESRCMALPVRADALSASFFDGVDGMAVAANAAGSSGSVSS